MVARFAAIRQHRRMQNPNTATPQFVADKSGYYIGRVEANDGLLAGFANTLVTSAANCDADANGVINPSISR